MRSFTYDQPGTRIVFGAGSFDQLPEEVRRLGATQALILASPSRREDAEDAAGRLAALGKTGSAIFAAAVMHVPVETVRSACRAAKENAADCCIVIGGGSTIGLGKAIALETGLPIVAVPTTYSGSEMTPIYGITEDGMKRTGRAPQVLPRTVLYDPVLTVRLPAAISGPSGMNALAHCMAAFTDEAANPIARLLAAEGARALVRSLPTVVDEPANLDARGDALYGSCLAGSALAAIRMNIHYRICHVLGGAFNLPHAEVHAIVLPHSTAYNAAVIPEAMRLAADALGVSDAPSGIFDLAVAIGVPAALRDIGMPADGLDRAAQLAVENPAYNPRPVDYSSVRQLLDNAFFGRR